MKALRFVSSDAREIERGRVRARGRRSETSTATLTATLTAPVSGLLWIVALSFEQLKRCWQLLLPLCGKLLAVVASKCWCLCVCVCLCVFISLARIRKWCAECAWGDAATTTMRRKKCIIIACHVEIYTIYGLFVCTHSSSSRWGRPEAWQRQWQWQRHRQIRPISCREGALKQLLNCERARFGFCC